MAVNLTDVNIDDIGGMVVVPEGTYTLQVVEAKEEVSKTSGNDMIVTTFEIIEGDYEGVKIKHYFTWASEWGAKFCKMFATAANVDPADFSAEAILGSTAVTAKVEVEEGTPYIDKEGNEKDGMDSNKINPFEFKSAM